MKFLKKIVATKEIKKITDLLLLCHDDCWSLLFVVVFRHIPVWIQEIYLNLIYYRSDLQICKGHAPQRHNVTSRHVASFWKCVGGGGGWLITITDPCRDLFFFIDELIWHWYFFIFLFNQKLIVIFFYHKKTMILTFITIETKSKI